MEIIEYSKKYNEQIKNLLVDLQEYLIEIDDWNTQVLYEQYKEESFKIDLRKVNEQEGKIYLAVENENIVGLIMGIVETKDEIDNITNDCAKTGNIIELIVKKSTRGKGIGKKLLKKIEEYFKSINCVRINIEVFGPNKNAHTFYSKSGYIDRDIIMSKKIDNEKLSYTKNQNYIGKIVEVKIDRKMGSKHPTYEFIYPVNYGYVPNTISGDGEELDCYVLGVFEPIDIFKGKCIAVIHRLNDNDDKLIVVPDDLSYTNEQIKALTEFQERFFDSEILR